MPEPRNANVKAALDPFVRPVARALRQRCGVRRGQRLVLAVSGGADSVAMLRAVAALAPRSKWQLTLVVAHVQHHLRDADGSADADAAFVEQLASALKLRFKRGDIDVAGRGNTEANARRLRYAKLAEIAGQCHASAVVTGHHADDQLETVLMRLLRGASARGLAGMRWSRRLEVASPLRLIRPLLAVTHAECVAYLQRLGQSWQEDATNEDTGRVRARLRSDVLPVLRDLAPSSPRKSVEVGEHLHELSNMLRDEAAAMMALTWDTPKTISLSRDVLAEQPPPLVTEVLRCMLLEAGIDADRISRKLSDPIVRAISDGRGGSRRFELTDGVRVYVNSEQVRVVCPP